MAIVFTNDEHYGDIADAIRLKNGTQDTYRPDEMAAAIEAIPGGLTPTGTIQITQNGNYNVTNYAEANVAVPGIIPAGVKSITADGTYDVTTYATANVNTKPAKGLVFGDYDSDGYPHSAEFVGSWTEIPKRFYYSADSLAYYKFTDKITHITIPDGVTIIRDSAFANKHLLTITLPSTLTTLETSAIGCDGINSVIVPNSYTQVGISSFTGLTGCEHIKFNGDITTIARYGFENSGRNASEIVFEFSECSSVPTLENVNAFYANVNKVIKVPQALLSTWQNATNWVGLTNVTWQGV